MSFIIGQPSGGGGGGGADAYSFATAITDFMPVYGFSNLFYLPNGIATYHVFRIDGTITLKNMGLKIYTLSSTAGAKFYGAIYKYDIATDTINLQDYTGEIVADTTSGVVGWNYSAFNGGNLTLDAGVYFSRILSNNGNIQIHCNGEKNGLLGYAGSGTSGSTYSALIQTGLSYDFGATPASISFSSLTKTTSASYNAGKPFYTITQP